MVEVCTVHPASADRKDFAPGDIVEALHEDGEWYLATIEVGNGSGTFIIKWHDGDTSDRVKHKYYLRRPGKGEKGNQWEPLGEVVRGAADMGRELVDWAQRSVASARWPTLLSEQKGPERRSRRGVCSLGGAGWGGLFKCFDHGDYDDETSSRKMAMRRATAPRRAESEEDIEGDGIPQWSQPPALASGVQTSRSLTSYCLELFRLHDLTRRGALEGEELKTLVSRIAMMQSGGCAGSGVAACEASTWARFGQRGGQPLSYPAFEAAMFLLLEDMAPERPLAQEVFLRDLIRASTSPGGSSVEAQDEEPVPLSAPATAGQDADVPSRTVWRPPPLSTVEEEPPRSGCSPSSEAGAFSVHGSNRASWRSHVLQPAEQPSAVEVTEGSSASRRNWRSAILETEGVASE